MGTPLDAETLFLEVHPGRTVQNQGETHYRCVVCGSWKLEVTVLPSGRGRVRTTTPSPPRTTANGDNCATEDSFAFFDYKNDMHVKNLNAVKKHKGKVTATEDFMGSFRLVPRMPPCSLLSYHLIF